MMNLAYRDNFDRSEYDSTMAVPTGPPRLRVLASVHRSVANVVPTMLRPGRPTLDGWLAAGSWFDFSRSGDLPAHWATGADEMWCENCGASAASPCSTACPARLLTSSGNQRLAVQVPCEFHDDEATGAGDECPHCVDGFVTAAWATTGFGPLRVAGYRCRLRRTRPDQFKLSDGSYYDLPPDIEPICLPGRWARGGSIVEQPR